MAMRPTPLDALPKPTKKLNERTCTSAYVEDATAQGEGYETQD